jgi:hypothetical protein
MSAPRLGQLLVAVGLLLVLAGIAAWKGGFSWMGRLPGDLRFESHGLRVYMPITSMLIVSAVVTIVINLLRRLF